MDKVIVIGFMVEVFIGKKIKLQEWIENYDKQFDQIKGVYDFKVFNFDVMKDQLVDLIIEKIGLKDKLVKVEGDVIVME